MIYLASLPLTAEKKDEKTVENCATVIIAAGVGILMIELCFILVE